MSTCSTKPLDREVTTAKQAQRDWCNKTIRQRLSVVTAFRHLLVEQADSIVAAVAQDVGKADHEVIAAELIPLAAACKYLQQQACAILRPRRVPLRQRPLWLWGQYDTVHRRPRGVIGIIGTWNYPVFLNGVQILQAATAGNAVIWKPSEAAPRTAAILSQTLRDAGFPPELVQVLPATREGGSILAAADVDHIVFTGSSRVGRLLAENLGQRLISSTLELSGCDPLFVLNDADVPLAAQAAWFAATINRGQTCIATRAVHVDRRVYGAFVNELRPLVARSKPIRLALASQAALAGQLIHEALASGAEILQPEVDAKLEADSCLPTVVLNASTSSRLCKEPSFAPIMAVAQFDSLEEALTAEASCSHALGAVIFTESRIQGIKLAERLRAGSVMINDSIVCSAHPATPFGGRASSGWGSTQGAEGLLEMTVPQTVSYRKGRSRPHYAPTNGARPIPAAVLSGLLALQHARTLRQRIGGLWRLINAAASPGKAEHKTRGP